ncbi:MAG: sugar transferase [Planctomycetota bacterium]|nr:MAG: sugar transferase [Planctomycetota bacterium]
MSDTLSLNFSEFVDNCFSNSLTLRSLNIGGTILDLGTEEGLLGLLVTNPNVYKCSCSGTNNRFHRRVTDAEGVIVSPRARLFGKVLFGQDVSVGRNAVVVGPTIIGHNVKIESGVVIRTSIIGSGVSLSKGQLVQNRVLINQTPKQQRVLWQLASPGTLKKPEYIEIAYAVEPRNHVIPSKTLDIHSFRTWPKCSYARFLKRIADIVAATIVLVLFAPIMPFIALAIRLNSSGPVFFGDERQGLHGKNFKCLKFRTMLRGADKLQDRLRRINQVDGPQFRIENDPRTSTVGRFLRNTHIDEIPQFVNVLLGQMSIVGPRPSPEAENTLCPYWRDARLSVRPGITGLWQICRTRRPTKDFQEWIYYDIEYVRKLSLKLDLWVCWKTAKKLIHNFISQF